MKKYLLALQFTILLSGTVSSQMFQETGTNWYYTVSPSLACFPCSTEFQKLEYIGDTAIGGINCNIIEKTGTLTPCSDNESVHEYLYQDGSKIMWYNSTIEQFTTLYDFNASVGEGWDLIVGNCQIDVRVDSVSVSSYNGENLKNLYVSDNDGFFSGKIIENIGHTYSFFPHDLYWICKYGSICDDRFINGIRCFNSSTYSLNFTELSCDTIYITNTKEIVFGHQLITVYPNPATKYVIVKNNMKITTSTFRLFDLMGNLLKIENIRNNIKSINLNFPSGFYFYSVETEDKIITGKLIVE